ncbi:MAG: glycosyltransferase family 4 protein [Gemmataceae bacterium]
MRIAIVDGDLCYPATSGKRLRSLNLLLPLAGRHRIACVMRGHGDAAENAACREFLGDHGVEAHVIDDPIPKKKGVGFYARLAANLTSPVPYSVASHRSEQFAAAVRSFASGREIDVWGVDWSGYLYAVAGLPGPVVLQAHNVDSLIWERYHDTARGAMKRWYVRRQWKKFERFEGDAFRRVSRVVFVSDADHRLARDRFGITNGTVVDNGVDVAGFGSVRPAPGSRSILYLGSLDWRPNLDAVELLLAEIFPRVRAALPESKLVIVGRKPPEGLVRRAAATPGVELRADVPDVKPYLAAAGVMAVPLRVGGGSRLKILEALACGLPVVSTAVGAEGLHLTAGDDYALADTPAAMADALVRALTRPGEAFAQAARGQEAVAGRYDWSALAAKLERVWESVGAAEGAAV